MALVFLISINNGIFGEEEQGMRQCEGYGHAQLYPVNWARRRIFGSTKVFLIIILWQHEEYYGGLKEHNTHGGEKVFLISTVTSQTCTRRYSSP
jgi:hypothetical protein